MLRRSDRLSVVRDGDGIDREEIVERIRVLLIGDDKQRAIAVTQALAEYGMDVLLAEDVSYALRFLSDTNEGVDAVLLDSDPPDEKCKELLEVVEALPKQPGIVILDRYADGLRPEAASCRAVWAPRMTTPSALASILRKAAQGYAGCTLGRFAKHFRLTDNECAYLDRAANGITPKQIAVEFGCSIQAVYAHLARLSTKTGCANYQEVIAKLFQFSCHGLGHGNAGE
jgi:DNA-binding CsgD family transcriptional regulator